MDSFVVLVLRILTILLIANYVVQGLPRIQEMELGKQLQVMNKPAIKSFQTKHGDIIDCVDIYKQPAFDHPLLKNHLIQMSPTNDDVLEKIDTTSKLKTLQLLSKDGTPVRCPKGTVPIKRTTRMKEDLMMSKFSHSSNLNSVSNADEQVEYSAGLEMIANNTGVHGMLNIWDPNVATHQFSGVYIYVASEDKSNVIQAGWSVDFIDYKVNTTRLYGYWTKDGGKITGCVDLQCPGFVQVSPDPYTLGLAIEAGPYVPGSLDQAEMPLSIKQDAKTGNWWVNLPGTNLGYYPKELFTTLAGGAARLGWGGIVKSPKSEPLPAMGTGLFPEEGMYKSCYIRRLKYWDMSRTKVEPEQSQVQAFNTKPECYKVSDIIDGGSFVGQYMFVGGPSCKL